MKEVYTDYVPRSLLITKAQYHTIYPDAFVLYRLPIVFGRSSKKVVVRDEIAEYLMKKYDGLSVKDVAEPIQPEPIVDETPEETVEATPPPVAPSAFIDETQEEDSTETVELNTAYRGKKAK